MRMHGEDGHLSCYVGLASERVVGLCLWPGKGLSLSVCAARYTRTVKGGRWSLG